MTGRDASEYYWIRAAEELERAEQAVNPTIAAVHHDLAYRYGALATQTETSGHRSKLTTAKPPRTATRHTADSA